MKKTSFKQKIALITFGLLLCIALIEIGLRISGFIILSLQEYRNQLSIRQKGEYRILCLGESTTALGGENSYPSQLEEILNKRSIGIKFSVVNKGLSGVTTGAVLSQLKYNLDKYKPDMVITMMGINDAPNIVMDRNIFVEKIILFLRSLRISKLMYIARLHIANRFNSLNVNSYAENNRYLYEINNFNKQEKYLNKTIEEDPDNLDIYFKLGEYYRNLGKYERAERILKKAMEINPKNEVVYIVLGWYYRAQGKYDKAREIFERALTLNPGNHGLYIALGRLWREQEEHDKAEKMYIEAMKIGPQELEIYFELAEYYRNTEKYKKAEKVLKKAMEVMPLDTKSYIELGHLYRYQGMRGKAYDILNDGLELSAKDADLYVALGRLHMDRGEYSKAEGMFKNAADISSDACLVYDDLAYCYDKLGRQDLAEKFSKASKKKSVFIYYPITRYNYRKLKFILLERRIKFVCAQYPLRSLKQLEQIFADTKDVLFVDNEKIFKENIKNSSYDEYFTDCFAGDFGHCTPKGNKLLAENIANTILKECFNR